MTFCGGRWGRQEMYLYECIATCRFTRPGRCGLPPPHPTAFDVFFSFFAPDVLYDLTLDGIVSVYTPPVFFVGAHAAANTRRDIHLGHRSLSRIGAGRVMAQTRRPRRLSFFRRWSLHIRLVESFAASLSRCTVVQGQCWFDISVTSSRRPYLKKEQAYHIGRAIKSWSSRSIEASGVGRCVQHVQNSTSRRLSAACASWDAYATHDRRILLVPASMIRGHRESALQKHFLSLSGVLREQRPHVRKEYCRHFVRSRISSDGGWRTTIFIGYLKSSWRTRRSMEQHKACWLPFCCIPKQVQCQCILEHFRSTQSNRAAAAASILADGSAKHEENFSGGRCR